MNKLLYIQASPREDRSHSRAVGDAFVKAYKQSHPESKIASVDIFKADLPPFDGLAVQAKYTIYIIKNIQKKNAQSGRGSKRLSKNLLQLTNM